MNYFVQVMEFLITILHGFSILVLVWGVVSAAKNFFLSRIFSKTKIDAIRENSVTKNSLGSYILLSLEILIAADIIKTILNPDINDILILGSIVAIRTVISFFLTKEIQEESDGTNEHYQTSVKAKERIEDERS